MNRVALFIFLLAVSAASSRSAETETIIDFEQAPLGKPVTNWLEKGVTFALARPLEKSKAQGRVMFFPHLATGHKGILCAMATEQIPVQATLPKPASTVTLVLWGSTACPALLEAFDQTGALVDKTALPVVPGRSKPEDPIPFFTLTVKAPAISFIRFSGPRPGEFLAADELRFTPIPD